MPRHVSLAEKAAALQRGLPVLGLKPLHARAGVDPRSARRWADGSRRPGKAQAARIGRLYAQHKARLQALSFRTEGVRERVNRTTGEVERVLGRHRLPDPTLSDIAERAAAQRQPLDEELATLGQRALLDVLDGANVASMTMILVQNVDEPDAPVALFTDRFPARVEGVVGLFIVQEYRRGKREEFTDRVTLVPFAPNFEGAAAASGGRRDGPDLILETAAEARRFGDWLASHWREAYTRIEEPEVLLGPSALIARVRLDRLLGGEA